MPKNINKFDEQEEKERKALEDEMRGSADSSWTADERSSSEAKLDEHEAHVGFFGNHEEWEDPNSQDNEDSNDDEGYEEEEEEEEVEIEIDLDEDEFSFEADDKESTKNSKPLSDDDPLPV